MMQTSNIIQQTVLFYVYWAIGFLVPFLIASHSPSKMAYGIIFGWWSACYFGYLSSIRIKTSWIIATIYIAICIISFIIGKPWFYHGAGSSFSFQLIIAIFIQSLLFISPIFVNAGSRMILKKVSSKN